MIKFQERFFKITVVLLLLFTSACQIEISINKPVGVQKKTFSPTATLQETISQGSELLLPTPTNQPSPTTAHTARVSPTPSPTNQPISTATNTARVSSITSPTVLSSINSTTTVTAPVHIVSTPSPHLPFTPITVIPAHSPPERISAPNIGLDAPVSRTKWTVVNHEGQQTSTWVVPDNAAGWHENSNLPGHGGNIVLSGHHNLGVEVFRNLIDLKQGNEIILEADGRSYHYMVTDRFILPERNVSEEQRSQNAQWIMQTVDEQVTLVTCWPYNDNTHRLIVVAKPMRNNKMS